MNPRGKIPPVLPILMFGAPQLRAIAAPVQIFHRKLQHEIEALAATLGDHSGAAALAAPQVGILKQVFVMNYEGEYLEAVNPTVVEAKGWTEEFEGCLSYPGFLGKVGRPDQIVLRFQDRAGATHEVQRNGAIARCVQHEIDHLQGILFIDRMVDPFLIRTGTGESVRADLVMHTAGWSKSALR